jgi:hypothetical protein
MISKKGLLSILCTTAILFISCKTFSQDSNKIYRVAKIKVDSTQLNSYLIALKEQMNEAIRLEPGVLSYHALSEKVNPCSITIFETYADSSAYKMHINTRHFRKYKETVKNMVLFLELVDMNQLFRIENLQ